MQTAINGSSVFDELNDLLASGVWSISNANGVWSFPVTNGAFSGTIASPINGVVKIVNLGTNTIWNLSNILVVEIHGVAIAGQSWSWDNYVLPPNTEAWCFGRPRIKSWVGARITQRGPQGFLPPPWPMPLTWQRYETTPGEPLTWAACPKGGCVQIATEPNNNPSHNPNYPGWFDEGW